jgi:hypothetical protein
MPTAAKLFAAVGFALVAFMACEVFKTTVPERTVWGVFNPVGAAIGFLCGWRVMGRLAGQGYGSALGYGLRTSVTILFWILLVWSIHQMIMRSLNMRYGGPMEAILGIFEFMLEFGREAATPQVLGALAVGGVLGGWLAEFAARRWR